MLSTQLSDAVRHPGAHGCRALGLVTQAGRIGILYHCICLDAFSERRNVRPPRDRAEKRRPEHTLFSPRRDQTNNKWPWIAAELEAVSPHGGFSPHSGPPASGWAGGL